MNIKRFASLSLSTGRRFVGFNTMPRRHLREQVVSIVRRRLKNLLRSYGYRVSKIRAGDFRGIGANPLQAASLAVKPFLVNVPLHDCRMMGAMAFACSSDVRNPFVDTLIAYRSGLCMSYSDSPLFHYYRSWHPLSAAEVLDLADRQHSLNFTSPLATIMPWGKRTSPAEYLTFRSRVLHSENKEHGVLFDQSDGTGFHGPVSGRKAEFEFKRLIQVYESIRSNGYVRSETTKGDIRGLLLCRQRCTRVFLMGGHHRSAALAALGQVEAPVRFLGIVRREDAGYWPNVCSGLFSKSEGLQIFDRVFDACQPTSYQRLASCASLAGE